MNSTHYIVAAYLGRRRIEDPRQTKDRLVFLREHMESLTGLKHTLDRITVVVQTDKDSIECGGRTKLDRMLAEVVPPDVNVIVRPNDIGLSYSALLAAADSRYEFTIFNEDDYIFTRDSFDSFLVGQLMARKDVSLVCGLVKTDHGGPHSAISAGIMRTSALDFGVAKVAVGMPQRVWSTELARHGILTDWLHYYRSAYWQDGWGVRVFQRPHLDQLGTLEDAANEITVEEPWPAFLVPIQALDHDNILVIGGKPVSGRVTRSGHIMVYR